MKAVVYEEYGRPEVLRLQEVEKPVPAENEILIKCMAVEVTKSDTEMRSMIFPVKWFAFPLRLVMGVRRPKRKILGSYFAGIVESIGPTAKKYRVGDRIFGATRLRLGAYAEYLCLPETFTIALLPGNMSFAEASAVPLGGLNALHFLRRAKIKPGEKVLVNGAGGSIGIFGVQIASSLGAEVTAVDADPKEAFLRRIGASYFIDYAKDELERHNRIYDVIFDMVAGSSLSRFLQLLAPGGRYLTANPTISKMLRAPWINWFSNKSVMFAFAGEHEEELLALKAMIEENRLKAVVDRIYTMEQAADAHHRVETEARLGSIVMAIASEETGL